MDEPWGRFHEDAEHRISATTDEREYRDLVTFAESQRPVIRNRVCVPLDVYLQNAWLMLRRAGRRAEADALRAWMKERRVGVTDVVVRRSWRRLRTTMRRPAGARVDVL